MKKYILLQVLWIFFSACTAFETHSPEGKNRIPQPIPSEEVVQWIQNPIIPGFNPDPSIIRVGEDYFIATSSFEWFPGIPLYHSKDLANWRPIGHAVTRKSQANLRGMPNSAGIYAPSLHFYEGRYYLVYTVVQTDASSWPFMATPNYLIWTDDIYGEWSDPVPLNSAGFDPSIYFEDGRAYVATMVMDFRKSEPTMGKIALQEIDLQTGAPKGPWRIIFDTTNLWGTEGPHIYKKNGYYYLMIAQGGTFYEHTVSVARSNELFGPYELDPQTPFMTSKNDSSLLWQRAGHGCLVETQDGAWYMAHLASRSLMPEKKSPLGRESCLQKVEWTEEGWLRLAQGGRSPADSISGAGWHAYPFDKYPAQDSFDEKQLRLDYQVLREPYERSWLDLESKPGKLLLKGRRPPGSLFDVSLVARRITHYQTVVETEVGFTPLNYRQKAGLAAYYDTQHFYWLALSRDDSLGLCAELLGFENGRYQEWAKVPLGVEPNETVKLKFEVEQEDLRFFFSEKEGPWQRVGEELYFGYLADEQENGDGFTGSMAALLVMDALYEKAWAEFEYFSVE